MRLKDGRGRDVVIRVKTLAQMREKRGKQPQDRHRAPWEAMEKLTAQALKKLYLCEGAPCAGCEVMCGYGRRYLELTGGGTE